MTAWEDFALCRGHWNLFYSDNDEDIEIAKTICRECPVRLTCREVSMRNREKYGVWGGLSQKERRNRLKTKIHWPQGETA